MITRENPVNVTQVCEYIDKKIDRDASLKNFWLRGEVSGFRSRSSRGHLYFELKDADCHVSCVMYDWDFKRSPIEFKNGDSVVCQVSANFYAKSGSFQLKVHRLELEGQGRLFMEYLAIKKRLEVEGLFDAKRKKSLPLLPRRVAVITAASGSVIHDILNVLKRRFPRYNLLLFPSKVQGEQAVPELCTQLKRAMVRDDIDVIIIARGGGSMEDLWCFNNERLAHLIALSRIPVISAIGHETDTTIADLVSDQRAPTPSAAAELVYPLYEELIAQINLLSEQSLQACQKRIEYGEQSLDMYSRTHFLEDPRRIVSDRMMRMLDFQKRFSQLAQERLKSILKKEQDLKQNLLQIMASKVQDEGKKLQGLETEIQHLLAKKLMMGEARYKQVEERLEQQMNWNFERAKQRLGQVMDQLNDRNPENLLKRGYVYVSDPSGAALVSGKTLSIGQSVRLHMQDRDIDAKITDIHERSEGGKQHGDA
ncbi:MAG: exodeoxyribonuclease VII large subunit [Eubacteriales bacterium]|nr:exodeoxyribonuclease VII large subunit [Eubacteriales bacterium]